MTLNRTVLRESWHSWTSSDLQPSGPGWLQWLWTLLFCAALALAFTLLAYFVAARGGGRWSEPSTWLRWYGRNLVVCLSVGACIHLLFSLAGRLIPDGRQIRHWRAWQRTLLFAGIPVLGVLLGWPLGMALVGKDVLAWMGSADAVRVAGGSLTLSVLVTLLMHQVFASRARQICAEQRASEAQLRLLQGQIEPHFLFNTLAGVIALIDHDAPRARQTLEAFTDYLRASLATLRRDEGTLAQELDLAEQYLKLMQARMDDRLHYSIDADALARQALLPPLLLQPLVENAVHHGLEPALQGGHVQVRARVRDGRLQIEVHDDGLGLQTPPRRPVRAGHGMALANIRERLLARHGEQASLTLHDAAPGTRACLSLPLALRSS